MRVQPSPAPAICVVPFASLSAADLYALLALRAEVFVLEQSCIYNDLDGLDLHAFHVLLRDEHGTLAGTARVLPPPTPSATARIGRVAIAKGYRARQWGKALMGAAMACAHREFAGPIEISAQAYLERFYTQLGFTVTGPAFDEDGIVHLPMRRAAETPGASEPQRA